MPTVSQGDTKPKNLFTRMVEFAFEAEVPGATSHDRLRYIQELAKRHDLKLCEALEEK